MFSVRALLRRIVDSIVDTHKYHLKLVHNGMRQLVRARAFPHRLALVEKDHRELVNETERYDRAFTSTRDATATSDGFAALPRACDPEGSA